MTSRTIESEYDRKMLGRFLEGQKLPFTVEISAGKHRSIAQNKLQRLWCKEVSEQSEGHTSEEIRGFCKLHIGVPILREENQLFRERYDAIVRPMPYEQKILLMMEPLDFPVTRIMSTKQKTAYLDAIYKHFTEKGIVLTLPDDLGLEAMRAA